LRSNRITYNWGMKRHSQVDAELLRAALVGYENQLAEIQSKTAEIRRQLGGRVGRGSSAAVVTHGAPAKRNLSAAVRERIAAAQRKRWAAVRVSKESTPKRSGMSTAARKRIAEATKKRWKVYRAQKGAAARKAAA